jgi:hypothetical protein
VGIHLVRAGAVRARDVRAGGLTWYGLEPAQSPKGPEHASVSRPLASRTTPEFHGPGSGPATTPAPALVPRTSAHAQ